VSVIAVIGESFAVVADHDDERIPGVTAAGEEVE
jgi:hypothetical protein